MPFEQEDLQPLTAVVNVRLTPEEKEQLVRTAALAGVSLSELVRRRSLGRRVILDADKTIINELRRLGYLLREALGNHSVDPAGLAAAIRAIRDAIDRIAR